MTPPPWPAPREAWYVVVVLMVAYLFSYVDRQILSMLVGPIKADLGLSDTEISLLHGLAFAICYTVLGVWPIGRWADTGNRRNIIAGGVFLWSLMTALCGRAFNYTQLFVSRVGVGVGEAALTPTAYSMLADYFPPERRGRALGLFAMGVYFGIGAAIMITGYVVQLVSAMPPIDLPIIGEVRAWQVPFLLLGPPGILVALWVMTLREPIRRLTASEQSAGETSFAQVVAYMRSHAGFYLNLTLGISLLTLLFNGLAFWVPAHFMRVHAFSPADVAFSYGPIMLVAGALGILSGGILADRWRAQGRLDAELRVGLVSSLALWPLAILVFQATDPTWALIALAPAIFCSSFPFGAASAALQLVTPNRLRARTSALYLLVINLTGIGFGATFASMISDFVLRDETRIGDGVSAVALVSAPLAAWLLWRAMSHYRRMQA
jgi:MFS family permease